jgi:hypothetical protein
LIFFATRVGWQNKKKIILHLNNIMSTFAELKCFNKLLLQKMKRMEEHHKRQMQERNSKIFNSYDSLRELVTNAEYGIRSRHLHCCDICHVWYNLNDDDDFDNLKRIYEDGDEYVCMDCLNEPTCNYKMCDGCDKIIDINYQPILKNNDDDFCRDCYRSNLAKKNYLINGDTYNIDLNMTDYIWSRHIHNSKRVIRELEGFSMDEIGDPYYHYQEDEF